MNTDILMAPIIIFMIVVAPIWLILHYRSKRQVSQGLTEEEFSQLNELIAKADKMSHRIDTLEAILDNEAPQWRNRHD
ncbi:MULTISPECIES: envelope stress response membrane protein PspB [Shewanella]|uniref:Envelope stress response membrane protein PspB n=1 Tax=Shewanella fidelis TaxID=173509 RepID=A0AAW8NIW8_9GAMM|nr:MULTISPECIES: envelope stress response membrane protein PspB [Shewanella]MDR8523244.1 envelope stress response membrane protein PspB [Shewanella fidelis]MDW4811430.1 envelope stress response membrane protein PspB [Shewanella fidelis]MDW4815551.1 envelope stress response membrane protein PspB [Shewanella fidelis]MDW4819641.1 envelope stress response membrane protein PspB [Shewanella fidelis]MDW4824385.1 envelope stress response membrane protein PspB [Shewanella fidelis]